MSFGSFIKGVVSVVTAPIRAVVELFNPPAPAPNPNAPIDYGSDESYVRQIYEQAEGMQKMLDAFSGLALEKHSHADKDSHADKNSGIGF
jgi:hypothetical protein